MANGIIRGGVRKSYNSHGDDCTKSRFIKVPNHKPKQKRFPDMGVNSVRAGRSVFFNKGIRKIEDVDHVLISAHSNEKIGRDIRTGQFEGYWIYTLTLEERATCPKTCRHWEDCYGNNMPFAHRFDHTDYPALIKIIEADIARITNMHNGRRGRPRKGLMVRLHALGDFFSVEYVEFWRDMLRQYPKLACYGYTARRPDRSIGEAIQAVKDEFPDRFRIRWSDGPFETDCTVSIERAEDKPADAFQCPEQLDYVLKDGSYLQCITCAACWDSKRNVSFIEH